MPDTSGQSTSKNVFPQVVLDMARSDDKEDRLEAVKLLSAYYKNIDGELRNEAKEELERLREHDKSFDVRTAAGKVLKWVPLRPPPPPPPPTLPRKKLIVIFLKWKPDPTRKIHRITARIVGVLFFVTAGMTFYIMEGTDNFDKMLILLLTLVSASIGIIKYKRWGFWAVYTAGIFFLVSDFISSPLQFRTIELVKCIVPISRLVILVAVITLYTLHLMQAMFSKFNRA